MSKYTKAQREEALADLHKLLKPGDEIYLINRHTSSSGMMRIIDPIVFRKSNVYYIRFDVAVLLGETLDRQREGIKITGAGMDMGWDLVHRLGYALYPDGFKLRKGMYEFGVKPGQKVSGHKAFNAHWL